MLLLVRWYAGDRWIGGYQKAMFKIERAVELVDGMPLATYEDRKARADAYLKAMRA